MCSPIPIIFIVSLLVVYTLGRTIFYLWNEYRSIERCYKLEKKADHLPYTDLK
jgi:hypothetical protein